MSDAAGKVQIILSVDKATYSQAMAEAQRQLDQFAGKAKNAGHATVTSVQAASASIRTFQGDVQHNIRAVEKFITTIPGVSQALKAAFPLVGGIAFATMLFDTGKQVYDFIQKVKLMPEALSVGFRSLAQAQMLANDELRLSNDRLDDQIAKLEHRPQNVVAEELDQARVNADKLADSLAKDQKAMADLMKENENGVAAILMGMGGTKGVFNAINLYNKDMANLGYQKQIAMGKGDTKLADQLDAQMKSRTDAERARLEGDMKFRVGTHVGFLGDTQQNAPGDQSSNLIAERAALAAIYGRDETAKLQADQAAKEERLKKDQDAKDAAAQAKEAAAKQVQAMVDGLNALKLQQNMSIKAEYDYWSARRDAVVKGSSAYNAAISRAIDAKQAELAVAGARSAHEAITKIKAEQKKDSGENVPDFNRAIDEMIRQQHAEQVQGYIDSNTSAIDEARNTARQQEETISEQAGSSLSHFAAALEIAKVHTQEYVTTLMALQAIVHTREQEAQANPTVENQRALIVANKTLADAQTTRQIQMGRDNVAAYGAPPSSALVGAQDALQEFVIASRDAAAQMRELVSNTLHGVNSQIVAAMMGQRTNFKAVGAEAFKTVANAGLTRAEGSLLSAVGLGKGPTLGTAANPMSVRVVGGLGGATKSAGSTLAWMAGGSLGKVGGFFGSLFKTLLPGFANGGYVDGPAIVGENGPELFNPSVSGHIIPNYKLTSGGSMGDMHINVDATGSTDPAQTQAAVMRGIAAAAPGIIAASVAANQARNARLPSSRRN